jgi:pentatricopeptide repeat protein
MLEKGFEKDIALLTILLQAYANRKMLDKVVDVFKEILDLGYTPDKYIYGILQKVALENPEETIFREWFENSFLTFMRNNFRDFGQKKLNSYDSIRSLTELFRHYAQKAVGGNQLFRTDFLSIFQKQSYLLKDPLAARIALEKLLIIRAGRVKKFPSTMQFIMAENVQNYKSKIKLNKKKIIISFRGICFKRIGMIMKRVLDD